MPHVGRLSDATANALLDLMFGSGHAAEFPSSYDIALSTSQPTNGGGSVTEPVGHGYAPAVVPNDDANWPAAVSRHKANGQVLLFPKPTGVWSTALSPILWIVIYDHGPHLPSAFRGWEQLQRPYIIGAASAAPAILPGTLVIQAPGN